MEVFPPSQGRLLVVDDDDGLQYNSSTKRIIFRHGRFKREKKNPKCRQAKVL
jgi:hypothetical protein